MRINKVFVRQLLQKRPRIRSLATAVLNEYETARTSLGQSFPSTVTPRHYKMLVAITAKCNARCIGCRYGRDFMPGKQLPIHIVRQLLRDAADAGYQLVRFYGGEPLLHPDLPEMVATCRERGLWPYVTTNGVLLGQKMSQLFDAGLREVTIGFYGVYEAYDKYVQTPGLFRKVEASIADVRREYGDSVTMQLNWLLMRPTCSIDAIDAAVEFAERYTMKLQIEMIHYSLPYFQEGQDGELQFRPEDRRSIETVVERLLDVKARKPHMIRQTPQMLRSIPDWLLKQHRMAVPCFARDMIWVGADGTVQLCYVTFKLGNLFENRLRDIIDSSEHFRAARDAFHLRCPNCHCGANDRIMWDRQSRDRYSQPWTSELVNISNS